MKKSIRARFALGLLGLALVVAAGLVAAGVSSSGASSKGGFGLAKSGEPDAISSAKDSASVERGPASVTAAEEDFQARAYPAADIPIQAVEQAKESWSRVEQRGEHNHRHSNGDGGWIPVGPSNARMPALLTFSGAEYIASGRITALVVDPSCGSKSGNSNGNDRGNNHNDSDGKCRAWIGAAGGGVWRTDNVLSGNPNWEFVSASFPTNAIGTLTYDAKAKTLYAGTGEPNASADSEAGLGLFKSTDGGNTWTHLPAVTTTAISGPYTGDAFKNRAINAIVVDPTNSNTIYVGSASAVRGVCSVSNGCNAAPPTPLPGRGVMKSTDGGQTFTHLNGTTLPFVTRGVTDIEMDPSDSNTLYVSQYSQGVYRTIDGGATWTKIFNGVNPASLIERDSLAVNKLPDGKTRVYMGAGDNGSFTSRLLRTDDGKTVTPATWVTLSSDQSDNYCGGQCWYDNVVYSPAGKPDTVYLGGSYDYSHAGTWAIDQNTVGRNNGRAFIVSNDAGVSWNDLTRDSTSSTRPNGMHPDSHAIQVSPANPNVVLFGSDGGIVRTSGRFADISAQCSSRKEVKNGPPLTPTDLATCRQLLSRVPTEVTSLNRGLSTLQFQSLSVDPRNPFHVLGGTQDNGTWEGKYSTTTWNMAIWGDGGQSGFSAGNSNNWVNQFTGQADDVNFRGGDPLYWVSATGDIVSSPEGSYFYAPMIADPNKANAGTIFQGSNSVWRTQDWGGDQAYLEAHCTEFEDHAGDANCGDFERIGPAGNTSLTGASYGDRAGTFVAAIERTPTDKGTIWAATGAGRLFITHNGDAAAASVLWTRLDTLATNDPGRFISSISPDPANANRAWVSYSGYNINTPATPGHVFEVNYNPVAGTATWTNLDSGTGPMGDLPTTDLVRDTRNGDLYASTDFGVMALKGGLATNPWLVAAPGLPNVEVAGLTIVPGARVLYAATHGRSAFAMLLP